MSSNINLPTAYVDGSPQTVWNNAAKIINYLSPDQYLTCGSQTLQYILAPRSATFLGIMTLCPLKRARGRYIWRSTAAEVLLSVENRNRIVSGPKPSTSLMSACQGPPTWHSTRCRRRQRSQLLGYLKTLNTRDIVSQYTMRRQT